MINIRGIVLVPGGEGKGRCRWVADSCCGFRHRVTLKKRYGLLMTQISTYGEVVVVSRTDMLRGSQKMRRCWERRWEVEKVLVCK